MNTILQNHPVKVKLIEYNKKIARDRVAIDEQLKLYEIRETITKLRNPPTIPSHLKFSFVFTGVVAMAIDRHSIIRRFPLPTEDLLFISL